MVQNLKTLEVLSFRRDMYTHAEEDEITRKRAIITLLSHMMMKGLNVRGNQ